MEDSFVSLASQLFWIREIEHIELYGFLLPITCLKECDIISMLVFQEEISTIALVNCHTLTKRWRSLGNVFACYWRFKKASLSHSGHILLPCSLIRNVWCGLCSLVARSFIYYRNQRTSPYALQTAAQKRNVNMTEASIWNTMRDADGERHTQPIYTQTRTYTQAHTVNHQWWLNRRQRQVLA